MDKLIPSGIRPITNGIGHGGFTSGAMPSVFSDNVSCSEFWRDAVTSRLAKPISSKSLSNSHKFLRSTQEHTIYETEYVFDSFLYFAEKSSVSRTPVKFARDSFDLEQRENGVGKRKPTLGTLKR